MPEHSLCSCVGRIECHEIFLTSSSVESVLIIYLVWEVHSDFRHEEPLHFQLDFLADLVPLGLLGIGPLQVQQSRMQRLFLNLFEGGPSRQNQVDESLGPECTLQIVGQDQFAIVIERYSSRFCANGLVGSTEEASQLKQRAQRATRDGFADHDGSSSNKIIYDNTQLIMINIQP